jgi:glucose-6-phosphate 1-dehydrogenase
MQAQTHAVFQPPGPEPNPKEYRIRQEDVATIVIFGATGDLAARKLIPAIYNLWTAGYLPEKLTVVGVARRDMADQWRGDMCEALKEHSRSGHGDSETCDPFVRNLFYYQLNFAEESDAFSGLGEYLDKLEKERGMSSRRLYYMAVGPEFFAPIVENLGAHGLISAPDADPWTRVIVEKPFGFDLHSARELNERVRKVLAESQIFRIDHYLGKETVQNMFAFRFGNAIFEPLFNQKYVDHVQITVAETSGMEGRRGAFYDQNGALRDVVQNHALQLLCLVAMDPPARFNAQDIRDEKVKVLRAVELPQGDSTEWTVRGQYAGTRENPGYTSEEGVAEDSTTETFVALRLGIDNWRWSGVPFFLRTGKQLKRKVTEIVVQFKQPPAHPFRDLGIELPRHNVLVFRIQPNESISLTFNAKPPGMHFAVRDVLMNFSYGGAFDEELPEAYERLLLDAHRGDPMLFMRADEIEHAWAICTDILDQWKKAPAPELYRPGSWGPSSAGNLFDCCEGAWRNPEE